MAEPPQIAVPTPIRIAILPFSFKVRPTSQAVMKAAVIVKSITKRL